MAGEPAVFFDRDDTLIRNVPYNGDPALVELLPHARESVERLARAGYKLFIVSNQSGVGRGLISREDVENVNREMFRQLGESHFLGVYNCYEAPGQPGSEKRKPSPDLLLEASKCHGIDLTRSYMIGDRLSDIQCAKSAGCTAIHLTGGHREDEAEEASALADFVAHNLKEAADWILSHRTGSKL